MSYHVHHVSGNAGRRVSARDAEGLAALGHELSSILTTLEHRRFWKPWVVPLPLVAHARQLLLAFEEVADGRPGKPHSAAQLRDLRARIDGLQALFAREAVRASRPSTPH